MDEQRIEKIISIWRGFANRQAGPEAFLINPDAERVRLLALGVLSNEESHGFKYCPCRLITQNKESDAKLICPCNFKSQKTWKEKGECWCSLFIRI
jgi:ferredoxin-thioredoxin reductase catalytic chain